MQKEATLREILIELAKTWDVPEEEMLKRGTRPQMKSGLEQKYRCRPITELERRLLGSPRQGVVLEHERFKPYIVYSTEYKRLTDGQERLCTSVIAACMPETPVWPASSSHKWPQGDSDEPKDLPRPRPGNQLNFDEP